MNIQKVVGIIIRYIKTILVKKKKKKRRGASKKSSPRAKDISPRNTIINKNIRKRKQTRKIAIIFVASILFPSCVKKKIVRYRTEYVLDLIVRKPGPCGSVIVYKI